MATDTQNKVENNYTTRYRLIKTVLMILAWVTFGINQEIVSTALEDLKVLLQTNYQDIVFALVLRNIGYMSVTAFIGLVYDRFIDYSESIMFVAKLLMILPNFLIPWIRVYWLSMCFFLIQGFAQAMYDVGGNQIIIRLWTGISNSPVNAMHAGFGIGAMITLNLVKPFIKFNSAATKQNDLEASYNLTDEFTNETIITEYTPDDIKLQVPYSIAGSIGLLIAIAFLVAQYFETKNTKSVKNNQRITEKSEQEIPLKRLEQRNETKTDVPLPLLQKLLFKDKTFRVLNDLLKALCLIFLLMCLFISINGFMCVLNTYMLTYLSKGPAKIPLNTFLVQQSLYWIFFVLGRFLAAGLAFKMNSLVFFFIVLLTNVLVSLVYIIPFFNSMETFYWFFVCISGITSGPLIPSCFMIANSILKNLNAFLVSLFCISLGIGCTVSLHLASVFLDNFSPALNWFYYTDAESVYIIPLILFSFISFCFVFYLITLVVYNQFKNIFENNETDNK